MAKARILVVEDDIIIAQDIERTLTKLGYDVPALAASGPEAIRQAREILPDLVLMDIRLQWGMDGVEAAEQIQRQSPIPVVYLTAHSDEATLRRAKLTGPFGYVLKPFEERELHIAVEIALYRHGLERKLKRMERWLSTTLSSIGDAVLATDAHAGIIYMNPMAELLTGWKQADALGKEVMEVLNVIDEATGAPIESPVARALQEDMVVWLNQRAMLVPRHGAALPVDDSAAPIRDEQGNVTGVVVVFRDISEHKQVEDQLRHYALHDPLTRLANRTVLMDRLEHALERAKQYPNYLYALLLMDLDHFKVVNDSLGHLVGDQLLMAVSRRLETCVRSSDTLVRLGGDEFAVLFNTLSEVSEVISVAHRILEVLASAFCLGDHEVFTAASLGIVVGTPAYARPAELLRDADNALYRAKTLGRGRYVIFNAEMHDQAMARLQLETELRRAIEQDEFYLLYQPIVSLATRQWRGFEALLRWQHPQRSRLAPAEFLATAEETGLLIPIGQWALQTACRQLEAWQKRWRIDPPLTIHVNLSGKQFLQPDLVEQVAQVLQETRLEARQVCLEITEAMILDQRGAATTLVRLHALGVQAHLDDFGTGYSSLGLLYRFPIDALKIDPAFVRPLGKEPNAIAGIIARLAHELGLVTIAEGVETAEQADQLGALGCEYAQGNWFAAPLEAEAVMALLDEQKDRQ